MDARGGSRAAARRHFASAALWIARRRRPGASAIGAAAGTARGLGAIGRHRRRSFGESLLEFRAYRRDAASGMETGFARGFFVATGGWRPSGHQAARRAGGRSRARSADAIAGG